MNKRAYLFLTFVAILGMMGAIGYAWSVMASNGDFGNFLVIGESQMKVVRVYQEAELDLLQLDFLSRVVGERVLYSSLRTTTASACGTYGGLPVWGSGGEECVPSLSELHSMEPHFQHELVKEIVRVEALQDVNYTVNVRLYPHYVEFVGKPTDSAAYFIGGDSDAFS